MSKKFTEIFVRNLKPQAKPYTVRESGGFSLRIRPSGVKSWIFTYDFLGQRRNLTLGVYPNLSLKAARSAHTEARELLAQGVDPAEQKQAAAQAKKLQRVIEAREPTVAALVAEYLENHAEPKKKSWPEDQRILYKDVVPAWGHRKARDITRRDVVTLVDGIARRGAGIAANRTLAVVRRMFNFAIERGILDLTPVSHVKPPAKENRRDRVLNAAEILAFWEQLETTPMSQSIRLALKLMLATGQRKGEILNTQWPDVDLEAGWWTIPAERAKNGVLHRVPLNATALAILRELQALNLPRPWLFPSPCAGGKKPITAMSVDHAIRRCDFDGLAHFTPHDLRRTVATTLGALGFNRLIQDKVLNHVDRTVGGIYDRHSYDKEKQQALDAWDRRLQEILTERPTGNVIALQRV